MNTLIDFFASIASSNFLSFFALFLPSFFINVILVIYIWSYPQPKSTKDDFGFEDRFNYEYDLVSSYMAGLEDKSGNRDLFSDIIDGDDVL